MPASDASRANGSRTLLSRLEFGQDCQVYSSKITPAQRRPDCRADRVWLKSYWQLDFEPS